MVKTNGCATVFHVSDLERSLRFYVDVLGFTEQFRFGNGYAGVEWGEVLFHLTTNTERLPVGKGHVYVFLSDVDTYYAETISRGAKSEREPADWPYGMRDFEIEDPDGNRLAFGMETKSTGT